MCVKGGCTSSFAHQHSYGERRECDPWGGVMKHRPCSCVQSSLVAQGTTVLMRSLGRRPQAPARPSVLGSGRARSACPGSGRPVVDRQPRAHRPRRRLAPELHPAVAPEGGLSARQVSVARPCGMARSRRRASDCPEGCLAPVGRLKQAQVLTSCRRGS